MKIGEVAQRTGLAASTLRYYEDIGLIPPPPRISKQRVYDEDIFARLKVIKLAQETGFTLNEIQLLLEDGATSEKTANQWRRMAHAKMTEIEQIIEHYGAMKDLLAEGLDCACLNLAECALLDI
jgi:MerR family redox-sensitive transcriptional activator SoxR